MQEPEITEALKNEDIDEEGIDEEIPASEEGIIADPEEASEGERLLPE